MKRSKLVLVEWLDSNVTHGWRPDGCELVDVAHCRVVGIWKGEDNNKVEIALGDSDCESKFETITIPKGCIITIKELRIK